MILREMVMVGPYFSASYASSPCQTWSWLIKDGLHFTGITPVLNDLQTSKPPKCALRNVQLTIITIMTT